jgi:hydroxymethylpyrimidine/phosphomethylpyrimidine kinase
MKRKVVLTIAGSDCSGGAGIQADLKTMLAHGVYGMSVITALTAQNTVGVRGIMEVTPEFLEMQLDAVFEDIIPDAVKIGMLGTGELITVVAEKLQQYQGKNVVIDPVMISTSGTALLEEAAVERLEKELFPQATLLTPNLPEAEKLTGCKLTAVNEIEQAARVLEERYGSAVLIKGGHRESGADDLLCHSGKLCWISGKRVDNPNTHGTGCTLSSAIASNLARGFELEEAVRAAKQYLTRALAAGLDLGCGSGPLDHGCDINIPTETDKS